MQLGSFVLILADLLYMALLYPGDLGWYKCQDQGPGDQGTVGTRWSPEICGITHFSILIHSTL